MKMNERVATLEVALQNLIDRYNIIKAQNLAMNCALGGLAQILPDELCEIAAKHYDFRCATIQSVVNDGKTDLESLAIQRKEFASTREMIFRKIAS